MIQFRHQFELGGAYWSANVVLNQAFCFVSVHLYGIYSDVSEEVVESLWMIVGGLFVFSMINFSLFLKLINPKYIHTFFSTTTGKEFTVQNYEEATTDVQRFDIFTHHKSYYKSINNDLKQWLTQNWDDMTDEDWFTAKMIKKIPPEVLPDRVLERLGGKAGRLGSIARMEFEEATQDMKVRSFESSLNNLGSFEKSSLSSFSSSKSILSSFDSDRSTVASLTKY